MYKKSFFKVVCESVNPFEKTIQIDENCENLNEVHKIMSSHPELMTQDMTWILYPMSIEIN